MLLLLNFSKHLLLQKQLSKNKFIEKMTIRHLHNVVLNQIHFWCFSKPLQSEWSVAFHLNFTCVRWEWAEPSNNKDTNLESCRFSFVTSHILSYRTEVQFLHLFSFNFSCHGWPQKSPEILYKIVTSSVLGCIDTKVTQSIQFF